MVQLQLQLQRRRDEHSQVGEGEEAQGRRFWRRYT
jgi:hypothetical protein